MARIAVIIISDQTVQNVQFIKEFKDKDIDSFWFVTTPPMQKKGCGTWIKQTLNISDNLLQEIEVNEFAPSDIKQKIKDFYTETDTFLVNITGGTKLMSIAVNDFFKEKSNATIYYLTGKNKMLNLTSNQELSLKKELSLKEYLNSYGINIRNENKAFKATYSREVSEHIYSVFLKAEEFNIDCLKDLRDFFQEKNKKAKKVTYSELPCLENLVKNFDFQTQKSEELSKDEALYLTGKWLEEYAYYKIKEKLQLSEQSIGLGLLLQKAGIQNTDNDFDVMFIHQNELYIVECKTSHLINNKSQLSEYIYKLDALRKEFGLYPKAFIYTLGNLPKHEKSNEQNQIKDRLKFHNIKLLTKENFAIENTEKFDDWLNSFLG